MPTTEAPEEDTTEEPSLCASGLVFNPEASMYGAGEVSCQAIQVCLDDESSCEFEEDVFDGYMEGISTSSCCESADGSCANDDLGVVSIVAERFGMQVTSCAKTMNY